MRIFLNVKSILVLIAMTIIIHGQQTKPSTSPASPVEPPQLRVDDVSIPLDVQLKLAEALITAELAQAKAEAAQAKAQVAVLSVMASMKLSPSEYDVVREGDSLMFRKKALKLKSP